MSLFFLTPLTKLTRLSLGLLFIREQSKFEEIYIVLLEAKDWHLRNRYNSMLFMSLTCLERVYAIFWKLLVEFILVYLGL